MHILLRLLLTDMIRAFNSRKANEQMNKLNVTDKVTNGWPHVGFDTDAELLHLVYTNKVISIPFDNFVHMKSDFTQINTARFDYITRLQVRGMDKPAYVIKHTQENKWQVLDDYMKVHFNFS